MLWFMGLQRVRYDLATELINLLPIHPEITTVNILVYIICTHIQTHTPAYRKTLHWYKSNCGLALLKYAT